ncbi:MULTISPECIES: cyclopropane-fatty-acyl-phospholipid synthase family protein [unclassified Brevundimonas]|uniref:SAM-dependent methyltransferase n=1 Tax=unclassified Brevundimonas TaxID=2622653 RepID=UPI0025C562E6|nr:MULTISPECIES: class I SAM-dependent methyltransferase [unclassified Brevundimonas]
MQSPNRYMNESITRQRLTTEGHRGIVGGMWDVIGPLQRDFLVQQGLAPGDRVLDVGCGALRAGVHLTDYLEPARYYGIDISASLLEAGYEHEIAPTPLADKLPRSHLHATPDFEAPFGVMFDFGLATSLFTHLPIDYYSHSLEALAPVFRTGARFFATVFEGSGVVNRPDGIVTYDDRDPFHFRQSNLHAATPSGWAFKWIGEWGHPRGQMMIELTRLG